MANQQSKNIQYSGLTTLPDDYQSVDGSLAFATNAVYEDNAVKIIPPALAKNLIVEKGDKVYVHSMATYTHYIVVHEGSEGVTLYWVDEADCGESDKKVVCVRNEEGSVEDTRVHEIGTYAGTFVDLAFVGNTVILSTSESLQYVLWKSEDEAYLYLGDEVPNIEIQFGLDLSIAQEEALKPNIETEETSYSQEQNTYTALGQRFYSKSHGTLNVYFSSNGSASGEYIHLTQGKRYRFYYEYVDGNHNITFYIKANSTNERNTNTATTLLSVGKHTHEYTYYTAEQDWYYVYAKIQTNNVTGVIYIEESDGDEEEYTGSITGPEVSLYNHTAIMGWMNKFVNERSVKEDKFIYPFFVRYAVRLYDGTRVNLSPPCLMWPNTGYVPFVFQYGNDKNLALMAFIGKLLHRVMPKTVPSENWKDLIWGVDVYVSPQFYCYDQGSAYEDGVSEYTYLTKSEDANFDDITESSYGIGKDADYDAGEGDQEQPFKLCGLADFLNSKNSLFAQYSKNMTLWQIAKREDSEVTKDIVENSQFYKVAEIKFDELRGWADEYGGENYSRIAVPFVDLEIEEGALSSLQARSALKEEEISADGFRGASLYTYNNRLHVYGGEAKLPFPYYLDEHNGFRYSSSKVWSISVKVRTDEGIKTRHLDDLASGLCFPWFFYPDTRAYELQVDLGTTQRYEYPLTTHEFLNGSYFFNRDFLIHNTWTSDPDSEERGPETDADDPWVSNLNKIYVSEASNPFVFKNEMVCTAGSGQVLALSSAAKALSQGQFGQFPLYAFTDEGIWAMSVGSTGAYETVQPIARDVVQEDAVKAITQLDSAVVFVTDRGVMLIEGSNVVCMSDDIDGDFGQFDPRTLDGFYDTMKEHLGFSTDDTDNTIGKWASQAFFDFIRSCQMKYDYVHQRITMYSDDCDIAYVYSLKSKQWLMQLTALQDNVNSYPDAYALRNTDAVGGVASTELVNLSEYDLDAERLPMVFVTRPFKLDAPDTFKTVNDIIQRGYFHQDENVKHIIGTVLYGSPDLFNWFAVKSNVGHKIQNLHGSPYKYFRVLVVSQLDAKEGISGCSVWFEPKDTQRMR